MTQPYELRMQLRALRQDAAPSRDLWTAIEPALDQAPARAAFSASARPRTGRAAWILTAGVAAITVLAVGLVPFSNNHSATIVAGHSVQAWQPKDPRLEGAAIELAAAQMELRLALRQAPSSDALRRLLLQTRQQQSRLQAFERQAG